MEFNYVFDDEDFVFVPSDTDYKDVAAQVICETYKIPKEVAYKLLDDLDVFDSVGRTFHNEMRESFYNDAHAAYLEHKGEHWL